MAEKWTKPGIYPTTLAKTGQHPDTRPADPKIDPSVVEKTLTGRVHAGDLFYGVQKNVGRDTYVTSTPVREAYSKTAFEQRKIVNAYTQAVYPDGGGIRSIPPTLKKEPHSWTDATDNARSLSGGNMNVEQRSVAHVGIMQDYYARKEHGRFPDQSADTNKVWKRGSKAGIEQTLGHGSQVHFVLDGIDLKDVFDSKSGQYHSITSTELRYIFRNQHDQRFQQGVKFYHGGKETSAPWVAHERYTTKELTAMDAYGERRNQKQADRFARDHSEHTQQDRQALMLAAVTDRQTAPWRGSATGRDHHPNVQAKREEISKRLATERATKI